ncbi:unnamed protein product, partial [Aureobasidium pullulans]
GRWELLDLNHEGLPKLLVKYVIGDTGYTVSITDLANIWIESLSNFEITRNAETQSCSINPGDDAGQLQILLKQIRDILSHKDGSVRIALQPPDDLTLALKAPLPFPLPPFEWTMRSLKRNHVATRVPGLAPFQPGSELQHSGGTPSSDSLYSVLRDASADVAPILTEPSSGQWWQDMAKQQASIAVNVPMPTDMDDDETDDDLDGFQTQTIPEQIQRQMPADISSPVRSSRRKRMIASAHDESTDDGRVTSSPPPIPGNRRLGQTETPAPDSPSKRSNTQTRRIGAIGGRSSSQALPPSLPPSSPPKPPNEDDADRGLRSRVSPTPSSMLPPPSQMTPSRRRRLGGIGRGSSQMQPSQPSLNRWSSQAQVLPSLEEEQHRDNELTIGLDSISRENGEGKAEVRQTRSTKRKASEEREPSPRETSVERADRKRNELKQNLNEKPKAPAKRKRRF